MKIQGKVTKKQTIEGSITRADLLALVRQTFHIPDGAAATFYVTDTGRNQGLIQQALICSSQLQSTFVPVDEAQPLRFTITWSLPVAPNEQG